MVFPENIGPFLSIDEVSLSKGELYTFVTNKNGRGKSGSLVASIKGTLAKNITGVLEKIPLESREKVAEVTLDMSASMETASTDSFPKAKLVTDRFHVVRLAVDAVQHLRVKHRWQAINQENMAIKEARTKKEKYRPEVLPNGDTPKQLLARSRYILTQKQSQWSQSQGERAKILFDKYPELAKAYGHSMEFRNIYEERSKQKAVPLFHKWIESTKSLGIDEFNTVANSVINHFDTILAFFDNRSTNAHAESFNSKIKLFRANLRGVTDTRFFLFRLSKLYA